MLASLPSDGERASRAFGVPRKPLTPAVKTLVHRRGGTQHHLRLISLAAVVGTALPILRWAKAAKSQLVRDVTLIDFLPIVM